MRVLTCASTEQAVTLTQLLASSGEGEVWKTDRDGQLAKIYFTPSPERIRKLEVMVAHPPDDPNQGIEHISFSWPTTILQDYSRKGVGFLMPHIRESVDLLDVYNPQRRQKVLPGFNWLYLHTTALNIASIIAAIHRAGYVLGDIKPQNILVNNRALPAIIDTDSFQVRDPNTGELHRCPVGSEEFTPVELLDQDLARMEQTEIHDRFRLAVVVYLLLFGESPYKGQWVGSGEPPSPLQLLQKGYWPYAPNSLIQPSRLTLPLGIVHPGLQDCFLRCFNDGHVNPELRPTAEEWFGALRQGVASLRRCRRVKRHYYSLSSGKCYWCKRNRELGIDIFAPQDVLQRTRQQRDRKQQREREKLQKIYQSQAKRLQQRITPKQPLPTLFSPGSFATFPRVLSPSSAPPNSPPPSSPISSPTPSPSGTSPSGLQQKTIQLGGVVAIALALISLLLLATQSRLSPEDLRLTEVGSFLVLPLVVLCFVWIQVLKRPSS